MQNKEEQMAHNGLNGLTQETIEKAALNYAHNYFDMHETNNYKSLKQGFIEGAKFQAERMYSEEDLLSAFEAGMMFIGEDKGSFREWFEQFKKK
jgi:hypothetical protein